MTNELITFKTDTETGFINVTVKKKDFNEYTKLKKDLMKSLLTKAVKIEDTEY